MTVVAQLVADVLEEGQFDADEAKVLRWLSRRQRTMCARSKCFRRAIQLGPTVAGQPAYAVPAEVVEIREVRVAGVVYGQGRHVDIAQGAGHYLWLSGTGGIAMREDSGAGVTELSVFPVPTDSGIELAITAVCLPPDLLTTDDTTLVVAPNFHEALVNGAIATGMLKVEARPDLAGPFETLFNEACEELAGQTGRRFRGAGPAQIRVIGVNA